MLRKKLSIFGATGSVGRSTLDVVKANPDYFSIDSLVANQNVKGLVQAAYEVGAKNLVVADEAFYKELKELVQDLPDGRGQEIEVEAGEAAVLDAAARSVDIAMCAIAGTRGLLPLMKTIEAGIPAAIANKEPLVAAGPQVIAAARKSGASILPVDSEHNAVFQVFESKNKTKIDKIILTASGGPFLRKRLDELSSITPAEAIKHPNWSMGAKISIDSATMMNKALEVIEAHYLFDMPPEKIDVVIHPQSVVHSMVSYQDGSTLAQLGSPDMKTPIAHALSYPDRLPVGGKALDFTQMLTDLHFEAPDKKRFVPLRLAYDALDAGQAACIALNAANEIAVDAFQAGQISFLAMTKCLEFALELHENKTICELSDVLTLDKAIRTRIQSYIIKEL